MSTPLQVTAWADANQLKMLERARATGLIDYTGIGSPDADAAIELARALDVPRLDDLRAALIDDEHDIAWIAARDAMDADARTAIRAGTRPVATSTLPPEQVLQLLEEDDSGLPAELVPQMRQSPGFLSATGALAELGHIECIHISMTSGQEQSSPWARLYDAMDIALHLLGEPDELFAVHAGPRPIQPDVLAGIDGHFSVAMRCPNRSTATIVVSDGGGTWDRRMLILGAEGRVIVDDCTAHWTTRDGTSAESEPQPADAVDAGQLIARQLQRIVDQVAEPDPPGTKARVLQLCDTARLSCLTGQAETVNTH